MALDIWQQEDGSVVSLGTMINPIILKAEAGGDVIERRLFLRHENLSGTDPDSTYGISVGGADTLFPYDKAEWIEVAEDVDGEPGVWSAPGEPKMFGDVLGGEVKPFWVRLSLPVDTQSGVHSDVKLRLSGTGDDGTRNINLTNGTFVNCESIDRSIRWKGVNHEERYWLSDWIDFTENDVQNYTGMAWDHLQGSSKFSVLYRSSYDATEETATIWRDNPTEVEALDYLQVKITLSAQRGLNGTGLDRYYQGGLNATGQGTSFSTGNDWTTWELKGFWEAPESGMYRFRDSSSGSTSSLRINDELIYDEYAGTSQNIVYINEGIHKIHYWWRKEAGSTWTHNRYVTYPGGTEWQPGPEAYGNELSDQAVTDVIRDVKVTYNGDWVKDYDLQVFDGPDVPELISPEDGYETEFFSPELTVYTRNCDYVEFQIDMVRSFDGDRLEQWTATTEEDSYLTTMPPGSDRPPGIWYWRARGWKTGMFSAWSDWRVIEILPLNTSDQAFYINANLGLEVIDETLIPRYQYLNVNIGIEMLDPTIFNRYIYLNTNIAEGIGDVIYPIEDDTEVRKKNFEGDGEPF